jgi:hypothetical protein
MNHFAILVHGPSLDVDALLQSTPLRADAVWRRGPYPDGSGGPGAVATSGISIRLGNGQELAFAKQQRLAAEFLEANREALGALRRFPGARYAFVGLHFRIEVRAATVGASVSISPRLLRIAGEIGMEVSVYVDLDRQDWFEPKGQPGTPDG